MLARIGQALSLTLIALAVIAGCTTSSQGGRLYTVGIDREIEAYLPSDLDTVHDAALTVVSDSLGYEIEREALDRTQGVIEARTAKKNVVRVNTYPRGSSHTRITIFVGPLGDESAAAAILDAIDRRVRARPEAAPSTTSPAAPAS